MIYGYIRVSTDTQDTNNQKIGVTAKAKELSLEIESWISDDGISGTKEPEDRQLGKLLAKINPGDVIITSELSRLGRKLFMIMRILEHCMKIGAKVYTVKDGYELGDNIQSKVLAFAFGLAAEIERDMISQRTIEGLKMKKLQGVLLGSPRKEQKIRISDEQLTQMVDMIKKGFSFTKIAKRMKLHRTTVTHHLSKSGFIPGQICGYKITLNTGNSFEVNPKNSAKYGINYQSIRNMYFNGLDENNILGIQKIETILKLSTSNKDKNILYKKSDHPDIDRLEVEKLIFNCLTIPEIHKEIKECVDYFTLYDYISGDTELSEMYREKGHLRVKSKRERY
jgi:DNA invertase Pin-like site-specific DNA recombinase